jgi:inner membrane protein
MIFLTHLSFALLLGLALLKVTNFSLPVLLFLGAVAVSSLLTDIDTATSLIGSKVKAVSFFFGHRRFFHSIVCLVIAASLIFNLTKNPDYSLAFIIGYGSHLLLDSLTRGGTALFWPAKLMVKGPFKTRGLFDMLLFISFTLIIFFIIKP